jgi:hypothetical protein
MSLSTSTGTTSDLALIKLLPTGIVSTIVGTVLVEHESLVGQHVAALERAD